MPKPEGKSPTAPLPTKEFEQASFSNRDVYIRLAVEYFILWRTVDNPSWDLSKPQLLERIAQDSDDIIQGAAKVK